MRIVNTLKRILLSALIAASLAAPGIASASSSVTQQMDGMGHAKTDVANCLERHQSPTAALEKDFKHSEQDDEDDPIPPESSYLVLLKRKPHVFDKHAPAIFTAASFVPPDIVILTTNLRV